MSRVRISGTPTKRVRITGIGTQGSAATPDATMMAMGGATRGYGMQQPGNGFALDRWWSTPAGPLGTTSKVQPFERVGTVLPEAQDGGDINAEKNERVLGDFDQDGDLELMNVGGPSHAAGGKNVDVPSNSFVFSDTKDLKIKNPDILKQFGITTMKRGGFTPADIASKYDLNNYKKVTADPNSDHYSLKTAQLMSDNYVAKLSKLAEVQEGMKGQLGMQYHDPLLGTQPGMRYGGIPKYDSGGDFRFDQDSGQSYNPQIPYVNSYPEQYVITAKSPGSQYMTPDIPGMSTTSPQPTDMSYANIPQGLGYTPALDVPGTGNKVPGVQGSRGNFSTDPNFYGNVQNLLQMATLKKFQPYEPVPQAVIPDTVFMDPTRAISAQQEEARSGSEMDAMSANPQVGRAMSLARQGVAGAQAANVLGQYHNQNVGIANAASQGAAGITNQLLERQANRSAELNKANFLSDRDYQREMGRLQAENVNRYQKQHDTAVKTAWLNKTSPYFNVNPVTQMPVFKSADAQTTFFNKLNGISSASTGNEYQDFANDLKNIKATMPGASDAEIAMAVKHLESKRTNATYDAMGRLKQFRESGYEDSQGDRPAVYRKMGGTVNPLMKMGGSVNLYDNTNLKKFMK